LLAHALLALMLLIAQRGAEAHVFSHLVNDEPAPPGLTQGCGQCLSSVPLLGAAPFSECLLLAYRWEIELPVYVADIVIPDGLQFFAFQARAPPSRL